MKQPEQTKEEKTAYRSQYNDDGYYELFDDSKQYKLLAFTYGEEDHFTPIIEQVKALQEENELLGDRLTMAQEINADHSERIQVLEEAAERGFKGRLRPSTKEPGFSLESINKRND